MNKFIKLKLIRYPRIGYGDYSGEYHHEYVNVDYLKWFAKRYDPDRPSLKSAVKIEDREPEYCMQTVEEIFEMINETDERGTEEKVQEGNN